MDLAQTYNPCRWPPLNLSDIQSGDAFNLAISVQFAENSIGQEMHVPRYKLHEIFNVDPTNETISFQELVKISEHVQEKIRYPEIFKTYPQDLPINELVKAIKAGRPINYVRINNDYFNSKCTYCSIQFCINYWIIKV